MPSLARALNCLLHGQPFFGGLVWRKPQKEFESLTGHCYFLCGPPLSAQCIQHQQRLHYTTSDQGTEAILINLSNVLFPLSLMWLPFPTFSLHHAVTNNGRSNAKFGDGTELSTPCFLKPNLQQWCAVCTRTNSV